MATDKTVSFPVRIPTELDGELQRAADLTGLSKQDLMRLCMRIGLVDLRAAEHDLPGIIKRIADDKGTSFEKYARAKAAIEMQRTMESTGFTPSTSATTPRDLLEQGWRTAHENLDTTLNEAPAIYSPTKKRK